MKHARNQILKRTRTYLKHHPYWDKPKGGEIMRISRYTGTDSDLHSTHDPLKVQVKYKMRIKQRCHGITSHIRSNLMNGLWRA